MHTDVPKSTLARALGPAAATAIVVGTVIGSGIFKKPQVIAANVPFFGPTMVIWSLGGILAFMGAVALAEVAVLWPRAGGNYIYLREAFGPGCGFLWGWVEFGIIKAATIAALGALFADTVRNLMGVFGLTSAAWLANAFVQPMLTVMIIVALAAINILGVKQGGSFQVAVTAMKFGTIALLAFLPLAACLLPFILNRDSVSLSHWQPLWPSTAIWSWRGAGIAFVGVLWTYHGWMNVAPVAEEVRTPAREIPLALFAGIGLVTVLYLSINLAYRSTMSAEQMAHLGNFNAAAEMCRRILGKAGVILASIVVLVSVLGGLNGNLLAGSRVLFALGRDRLAPAGLARVHPRFRTPHFSILVLACWSSGLVLGTGWLIDHPLPVFQAGRWTIDLNPPRGKALFDVMSDYSMFGAAIFETLAVATIFVFRRRSPDVPRTYRCWGYPAIPGLYVAIMLAVVLGMVMWQRAEAMVGLLFIGGGAAVYRVAIQKPSPRDRGVSLD
jgi:APA family basic amino acid/polyamine antiporter